MCSSDLHGVGLDRDGSGYPHLMLQKYLLQLKNAGVLLAICSKNSMQSVQDVFANRPEMILKLDDFVAHEVNWEPKSTNVARILDSLQLTSVGATFLDDSKFEREEVKSALPEIYVPELPPDPADWCDYLSRSGCLTVATVSAEDLNKSASYIAEKRRREEEAQHTDYAAFQIGRAHV